ncbi:hypothetical protein FS837_012648 [Tulasnella sp. UAMH 9824]|nr:hypothetical protein FS837_012648 [Tulasnella sp. UAMH 9824]
MARAALNASPSVNVVLASNFSYDWTMQTIVELGNLKSINTLRFEGWQPSDDHCNPSSCLDNLGDQIQYTFARLGTLQCFINTISELESLRQVVLRRHQAIASQEQDSISPLQEVIIEHSDYWDLKGHCEDSFDDIQALIVGGNLQIQSQCWRAEIADRSEA